VPQPFFPFALTAQHVTAPDGPLQVERIASLIATRSHALVNVLFLTASLAMPRTHLT